MTRTQFAFAVTYVLLAASFISYASFTDPPTPVPDYVAKVVVDGPAYTDTGTGVYIDHGLVLTAAHNLRDLKRGYDLIVDGLPATIIYKTEQHDFAILSVPDSIRVSPFPKLSTDLSGTLTTQGYVRGVKYTEYLGVRKQGRWLTAEVRQGMSGGPVINEVGDVVGTIIGGGPGLDTYISDVTLILCELRSRGLYEG